MSTEQNKVEGGILGKQEKNLRFLVFSPDQEKETAFFKEQQFTQYSFDDSLSDSTIQFECFTDKHKTAKLADGVIVLFDPENEEVLKYLLEETRKGLKISILRMRTASMIKTSILFLCPKQKKIKILMKLRK